MLIIIIAIVCIIIGFSFYNTLQHKKKLLKTTFDYVQQVSKRYYDVFFKLSDIAKGHLPEEHEQFTELYEENKTALEIEHKINLDNKLSENINEYASLAQKNDKLQFNNDWNRLLITWKDLRQQLKEARILYNEKAKDFNVYIDYFPIFAQRSLNLSKAPLYIIEEKKTRNLQSKALLS